MRESDTTTSHPSAIDPSYVVLEVLFRLLGVNVKREEIIKRLGHRVVDIEEISRCAKAFGFTARRLRASWDNLESLFPAVAELRGGGFLLIGRVSEGAALVLRPGASRPDLMTRVELDSVWDGRLVVLRQRKGLVAGSLELGKTLGARAGIAGRSLTTAWGPRFRGIAQAANAATRQGGTSLVAAGANSSGLSRLPASSKALDDKRTRVETAFLPAALEIVETPPSPIGRATAFTIMALIATALIWACLGTTDVVAIAPGKIVASAGTKTIQPFETGVVRGIHVRDGQSVKKGDILIELDATMSAAELGRLRSDLLSHRLDIARLRAVLSSHDNALQAFRPPNEAPAELTEMARRFLSSQIAERNAKLGAIDRQVAQKEAERATFKASVDKLKATLEPLQQRVDIREQLYRKELGSKLTYLAEHQEFVSQREEIVVQQSRLEEANAAIAVLREARAQAEAENERSLFEELTRAEQKAAGLLQDIVKAEQRTNLQKLRAPIDGTVQQLSVHTIGGVVTPAQVLMMVVPVEGQREIEAMVANKDIGFVEAGQEAAIKIDTFTFTRYGLLQGRIVSISQDAITHQRTPKRGQAATTSDTTGSEPRDQELVYAARIAMDRSDMDIDSKRISLSLGMAVTAEIKTGSRSIISYLVSPIARYAQEPLRER